MKPPALPHMVGYLDYVLRLEAMALTGQALSEARFELALNGEAGHQLRQLVRLPSRRRYGAFFTGSGFAARLLEAAPAAAKYCDPSCGAGDLLLAASRNLPVKASLEETLAHWSPRISGFDIHPEFVRAAKARLVLLARQRGMFGEPLSLAALRAAFPNIKHADALTRRLVPEADLLIMNPPYFTKRAPANCPWGSGKINYAAVFVEHFLAKAKIGASLVAILPDVLRSGSNYRKWRERISALADEIWLESWGLFDANADVDVFMLKVRRAAQGGAGWPAVAEIGALGQLFDVSVGAVVPHRHKEEGLLCRYLDARSAPSFGIVRRVKNRRRFLGPTVMPPFVTIKRTSRPGDKHRAIATVVTGKGAVAVENHLIVCRPKDASLAACTRLLEKLKSPEVSRWLDQAIRCRHLTVGAVRSIDVI